MRALADIVSEKGALVADERENTVVEAAAPEAEKTGTGDVPPAKKKFVTRDVVMCIVVLAAIALVAGVLLGAMNWLTYVDPEAAILEQVAGYYSVSADAVVSVPERVVSEGSSYVSGCYAVETGSGTVYVYHAVGSGAKSGTLEVLVHIGADGEITEIEEYSQSETAGYFKKVFDANRTKYIGKNVAELGSFDLVDTVVDDNDIDKVSTATLTSTGLNNAVNAAAYAFNNYKEASV